MRRPGRRQAATIGLSVAAHAALFAWLALQAPTAPRYALDEGLPEAFVPVVILPRPEPERAPVSPAPLRPRMARTPPAASPVAPLVIAPSPPVAPATGPRRLPSVPKVTQAELDRLLRKPPTLCQRYELNRATRDECFEQIGRDSRHVTFKSGLTARKESEFDRVAARKRRDYEWREGGAMPPGLSGPGMTGGPSGLGETGEGRVRLP